MFNHGQTYKTNTLCLLCIESIARSCALHETQITKGGQYMTYMQNLYAQHVEKVRADRAQEALKAAELQETVRSHKVNEGLSEQDLKEKIRHQIFQDTETLRHNMVSESEIAEHNRNTEAIQRTANRVALLGHQLNAEVQREKMINDRDIAELKNATDLYLGAWQNRINEANSKSQKQQATAKLMEAKAKIDAAEAALRNAAVNEDLSSSQKFANYTRGVRDIATTVETTSDVIRDWIPQTAAADTATDEVGKLAKKAAKTGKKNAKSTGNTAKEIIEASKRGTAE